jgi:hypothetical protein
MVSPSFMMQNPVFFVRQELRDFLRNNQTRLLIGILGACNGVDPSRLRFATFKTTLPLSRCEKLGRPSSTQEEPPSRA